MDSIITEENVAQLIVNNLDLQARLQALQDIVFAWLKVSDPEIYEGNAKLLETFYTETLSKHLDHMPDGLVKKFLHLRIESLGK
jgi:hypothetical protein